MAGMYNYPIIKQALGYWKQIQRKKSKSSNIWQNVDCLKYLNFMDTMNFLHFLPYLTLHSDTQVFCTQVPHKYTQVPSVHSLVEYLKYYLKIEIWYF